MARNGSGTYDRVHADYADGTTIEADDINGELNDMASALTQSLSKDGQTTPTGNLPMGGFRLTGLGDATASSDAMAYGQRPGNASGNGTTFLGADVNLNNTSNFFDGPNTGSIGASGQKWLITATASLFDSVAANMEVAIYDGTAYVIDALSHVPAGQRLAVTLSVVVTLSGATTFTLRVKDPNNTTGLLAVTNGASGVSNKATSITAVRIA